MTITLIKTRLTTRPKGVTEDVFVKVGKFHFPTDFVVVDFEADPRVPLILRRSFLRTGRALIDVYGEEITLRVYDEFITLNHNQIMRYSSTYDDNSVNRIDVIDIACEEYAQDVLDFKYNSKSGDPTLVSNPLLFSKTMFSQYKAREYLMTITLIKTRLTTRPKGVAEDVFVKVGKFHFPTDFVVVDFEADPRVPLILGRSFLMTGRALIDFYGEEITLRVNNESVTLNLNQTMRYSSTYDDNSVNRIDVIDIACEEYAQDVLDFKYNSKSDDPTIVSNPSFSKETKSEFCKEPIVKFSSPTLTPFGESDFLLEEMEDFLKDESIPMGIEDSHYDPKGDILYLEKLLNDDPSQLPPMDLKQAEETKAKSSIEEPSELELKELPSHLEYAFLEETDKLPVIIEKDLKDVEKEALLKVLKSHKRAIA
nr:reverse transcriptase domain-containing protein [Tanacetum cinerariifolium]